MSANARTMFVVLLLSVANIVELRSGSKHTTTEPHSVTLHVMGDDSHLKSLSLDASTAQLLTDLNTLVDSALDVTLKATTKVTEHGRSARKDNVLVQRTTSIDRTALNGIINNLGKRSEEVTAGDFRVEEDLRTQESFISNITLEGTLGDRLNSLVHLDALVRLGIELGELLNHIRADITVGFLKDH